MKKFIWAIAMLGAMVTVTSCSDDDDDLSVNDVNGKYKGTLAVIDKTINGEENGGTRETPNAKEGLKIEAEVKSNTVGFDSALTEWIVKDIEGMEDVADIIKDIKGLQVSYTAKLNDTKDEVLLNPTKGAWKFSYQVEVVEENGEKGRATGKETEKPEMKTVEVEVNYTAGEDKSAYAGKKLTLNLVVESIAIDGESEDIEPFHVAIDLTK